MVEFNLEVGVEVKIEVAALILFNLHAPQQLITYYLLRGAAIDLLLLLYIYKSSYHTKTGFSRRRKLRGTYFVNSMIRKWNDNMCV